MTQDEIIEMAREAGLDPDLWNYTDAFEAFAKLVAEKAVEGKVVMTPEEYKFVWDRAQAEEREACAKICENYADTDSYQDETSGGITTDFHAKLIRARGKK